MIGKAGLITFLALFGLQLQLMAQDIVINEVMASNVETILDEEGEAADWIELMNVGSTTVDLAGFSLTDNASSLTPWTFPSFMLQPGQHLLVFASDKNRNAAPLIWETVIDLADEWKYIVPASETDASWRQTGFDDGTWQDGATGIGYGDGDDSTVVEGVLSVFLRKTINISNIGQISEMILHMDYDDGFVAYLNGTEIARSGLSGTFPAYNAAAESHEAVMFSGGQPEAFPISNLENLLNEGENVLCVQVHNTGTGSSDMTIIPILSFGSTVDRGGSLSDYLSLSQASLHTDFKIASDGDTLMLFSAEGVMLDSVFTGNLTRDVSIGRSPDGTDTWAYFSQATPGAPNDTESFQRISGEVTFSSPGGLYAESQQITLNAEGTGQIFYTTDGSIPTTASLIYSVPVSVSSSSVLRARVIAEGSMPGPIKSASYLIGVSHDLPVVSIAADPYEFFDPTDGMYSLGPNASPDFPYFGANFWQEWEREVHVEMYEADGTLAFSAHAGAKIFGAYSRGNAQKSLSLFFRKSYGDGPIKYKLFEEKELDEFSSIVLRNSGNDWNNTMMRDGLMTSLFHKSVDRQAYRPAVVYINGEYFGIQNIREKINEHFIADNHGLDSDDIDIVETNSTPVVGNEEHYRNLISFVESNSLADASKYEYVKTQMDVQNFIYYMTGNIFINNTDWPGNNIKYWRENSETGQWRWIAFDTDFGFGIWNADDYVNNTLAFALEPYNSDWPNPAWSTLLLRKMIENQEFKNLFINTYADQLNSSWKSAAIEENISQKSEAIENEIEDHMARWSGSYGYWLDQIEAYHRYAQNRPSHARTHILSQFGISGTFDLTVDVLGQDHGTVAVNTLSPEVFPWSGNYMDNVPVRLSATPDPGYRFVGWIGYTADGSDILVTTTTNVSIKAVFEEITGASPAIVINEINYSSSAELDIEDWVELYNPETSSVNMTGWTLKDDDDSHAFVFPENTLIAPHGFLVVCRDVENFSDNYLGVGHFIGDMDFGLSGTGDCVRLFDQNGDLVKSVCYDIASPWPVNANGTGATLALKSPYMNSSNGANWYAQANKGNPGESNNDEISGVDDQLTEVSLSNYPNPFNRSTSIEYEVKDQSDVQIQIFDMQGRMVKQLIHANHSIGRYEVSWQPDMQINKGMYIVRMVSQSGIEVRRLVYY